MALNAILRLLSLLVIAALLVGCGGTGGKASAPGLRASVHVNVEWPAQIRSSPFSPRSVRVIATVGGKTLGSEVVVRPDGGGAAETQTAFSDLPVGKLGIRVTVYSGSDGVGDPVLTGDVSSDLQAGKASLVQAKLPSSLDEELTVESLGTGSLEVGIR